MLAEANPLLHERLEHQAHTIEEVLERLVAAPVRLRIGAPVEAGEAPARRMSEGAIKADRLKGLRRRDPALDVAADELDLEIVE